MEVGRPPQAAQLPPPLLGRLKIDCGFRDLGELLVGRSLFPNRAKRPNAIPPQAGRTVKFVPCFNLLRPEAIEAHG